MPCSLLLLIYINIILFSHIEWKMTWYLRDHVWGLFCVICATAAYCSMCIAYTIMPYDNAGCWLLLSSQLSAYERCDCHTLQQMRAILNDGHTSHRRTAMDCLLSAWTQMRHLPSPMSFQRNNNVFTCTISNIQPMYAFSLPYGHMSYIDNGNNIRGMIGKYVYICTTMHNRHDRDHISTTFSCISLSVCELDNTKMSIQLQSYIYFYIFSKYMCFFSSGHRCRVLQNASMAIST